MGGSSTFNKALNGLDVKRKKPPDVSLDVWLSSVIEETKNTTVYVDMSVLIRAIHGKSTLGFDAFFAHPSSVRETLLAAYCSALEPYLKPLQVFGKVVLVFERGGSRQSPKRIAKLNGGIRNVFLKKFHGSTFFGKRTVSRNCGLPPLDIQHKIAITINQKFGYEFNFSTGKADVLIFQLANAAKVPCFVYSVDHDYLIYSTSITGLIGPLVSRPFVCFRQDVMQGFGITSNQLIWCYCAAGSDDVVGLPNIGFKRALTMVLKDSVPAGNVALLARIREYLRVIGGPPAVLVDIQEQQVSNAAIFILQTKLDGSRRRLLRLGLDPDSPYGIGLVPWVCFGTNSKQRAKYPRPFRKIDDSKAENARNFNFNLEVQELEAEELEVPPETSLRKRKSTKRKAENDPEPSSLVKKRKRNPEKQVLDRLSSLHMKCVRTVGSLRSVVSKCIVDDFVPWFQTEIANFKVFYF